MCKIGYNGRKDNCFVPSRQPRVPLVVWQLAAQGNPFIVRFLHADSAPTNPTTMKIIYASLLAALVGTGCTVVRPGEVGVRQTLGRLNPRVVEAGPVTFNPFTTTILKVPVRTVNQEVSLSLPSKEGLTIQSEISILYNVQKNRVPLLIEEVGKNFDRVLILSVFRSAAADITAQYMAKDMHSGMRGVIEQRIQNRMDETLIERGITVERVLLKSIQLPSELSRAIERKLQAEQEAQQMQYVLERERQEATRRRIEAEGTRDAQQILQQGLSREIIELRSIEAFRELAESPNAKIIITDGKTPYLINTEQP